MIFFLTVDVILKPEVWFKTRSMVNTCLVGSDDAYLGGLLEPTVDQWAGVANKEVRLIFTTLTSLNR